MTNQEFEKQALAMVTEDQILIEVVAVKAGTIAVVDDFVIDRGDALKQEVRLAPKNKEFWNFVGGWNGFNRYFTRNTIIDATNQADDLGYEIVAIDSFDDGKLWIQVDYRDDDKDYIVEMTKLIIARNGSMNDDGTAVEIDDNGCDHIAEDVVGLVNEIKDHKLMCALHFAEEYLAGTQPEFIEALKDQIARL